MLRRTGKRMRRWSLPLLLAIVLVGVGASARPLAPISIHYDVWMNEPHKHYFEVAITVTGIKRETLDFVMPVWMPGSYLIREYARHVVQFAATDSAGRERRATKVAKNIWRVVTEGSDPIRVRYRVYAFDPGLRGNYLDDTHAYINGPSLFMYVDGFTHVPVTVRLHPAPGWPRISTGLDPAPDDPHLFRAPNYDVLVDCPILIGTHTVYEFDVGGIPHRLAILGEGNYDAQRLVADVKRIVETTIALFGDIPYAHYTFLVLLGESGSSGIEHANSTVLQYPRGGFQPESAYKNWLGLVAHEFFHLYNGKRLRPVELGPFDYTRENYTRMLWVVEGFTEYYADVILRRAGLLTEEEFLESLARTISTLQRTPGRRVQSLAEASFDAWIKFYRPDENSPNVTISYYTKGAVLAALLDLQIRAQTRGRRSLDDVMRLLYEEFFRRRDIGYREDDFRRACEQVAGGSSEALQELLDRYVHTTAEIEYDRFLAHVGLRLEPVAPEAHRGYLGIETEPRSDRLVISRVVAGSPAEAYGLFPRDEIRALDGQEVTARDFWKRLNERKPGERVAITVRRRGQERTVQVVLASPPVVEYRLVPVARPTPEQQALYRSWVSAEKPRASDERSLDSCPATLCSR
ncbi:MAG: PDZ domain-containing protein [Blastocatellia bacterium]|nr:PDZ domain-containing protein [Blastocatellia bacterium]MCS7157497.1 PDZ domain-containing protein [Blastocatellia bacterium]MCX7752670.1 PDZ domain-containing protein [Blastocatellia bacterium]MDW8168401.1 PDZ domain-containing protein [Acidobacteriota bacterium]MDW8255597.1 PDZ domain-containing protein [Acidobacteriota bacterium]